MFDKLQSQVYRELRDTAGLTQRQLAKATGLSRRTIQRIEQGHKVATGHEAAVIIEATECTGLLFAELICKAMSEKIGRRVTIRADDELAYQSATPEARANELLILAYDVMPQDLWWTWKERLGRHKARGLLHEQEGYALVRDLKAELDFHKQGDAGSGPPGGPATGSGPPEEETSDEPPDEELSADGE